MSLLTIDVSCAYELIFVYGFALLFDFAYLTRAARIYIYYKQSGHNLDEASLLSLMEQTPTGREGSNIERSSSHANKVRSPIVRRVRIDDRFIIRMTLLVFAVAFVAMVSPSLTSVAFAETMSTGCPSLAVTTNVYFVIKGACPFAVLKKDTIFADSSLAYDSC